MAAPISLTVDPFAGGQITMDQTTFQAAQEMLKKPPNDPGNVAAHQDVYLAAMLVDLRSRALKAVNTGASVPREFICPVCRAPMYENQQHQSYECDPCGRGFTFSYISTRYFSATINAQLLNPSFGPAKTGRTIHTATPKRMVVPRLTDAAPTGAEIDLSKVKVDEAVKDEPVRQYRSWVMDLSVPPDQWALQSVTYKNERWKGMEPMKASHSGASGNSSLGCAESGSPSWHCNCGLYGVKTLRQAQEWGKASPPLIQVIGKASFWGRLHHYENGLRAEYAYPWQLWIPEQIVVGQSGIGPLRDITEIDPQEVKKHLEKMYGVEVEIDSGMFNLGLSHN